LQKGQVREVLVHGRTALKLQPDNPALLSSLAWVLATWPEPAIRNGTEAVALGQRAERLTGDQDPVSLRALAAAYAETGRFDEAVASSRQALKLAALQNNADLAGLLNAEIKCYQAGFPFHESTPAMAEKPRVR